jgi:hypothetical protein
MKRRDHPRSKPSEDTQGNAFSITSKYGGETMKSLMLACVLAAALSACDSSHQSTASNSQAQGVTEQVSPASDSAAAAAETSSANATPAAEVASPQPPAPPPHNYVVEQDGAYGYQPALSEDDVKAGTATKALIMMHYLGQQNGIFTVAIFQEGSEGLIERVSCSAPCNFAKVQDMVNGMILRTETVPVTDNSIIGAMLADATDGQLTPYGHSAQPAQSDNAPAMVPSPEAPPVAVDSSSNPASTTQGTAGLAASGPAALATSFDCTKARSDAEHLICSDPELAADDVELAGIYVKAKAAAIDQAAFKEHTRQQWNYREQNCRDRDCLVRWYADQKTALTQIA